MVKREEFNKYLKEFYSVDQFEDYCVNGLVVEGKEEIGKIGFGVSFNLELLHMANSSGCDALVVHHGIFDKGPFAIKGYLKGRLKKLFDKDLSLFSLHLPMDAHPDIGHNALLFKAVDAVIETPVKWGFTGRNSAGYDLDALCKKFAEFLIPAELKKGFPLYVYTGLGEDEKVLFNSFGVLDNGPVIPERILIASGGSTDLYESAIQMGVDTFICGEIKEQIPAISYETKTNFINLGHYYSERPGVLALKEKVERELDVQCEFFEIPNPV